MVLSAWRETIRCKCLDGTTAATRAMTFSFQKNWGFTIGELFVFLLWQIITFLGILIIADEVRHMFKQILRRFENYQFSKRGSALMTQMPIDVFIELISLLNISVDFKVAPYQGFHLESTWNPRGSCGSRGWGSINVDSMWNLRRLIYIDFSMLSLRRTHVTLTHPHFASST